MSELKLVIAGMVVVIASVISMYAILWAIRDYRKQKTYLEGLKFRKKYGCFNVMEYAKNQKGVKNKAWTKQENHAGIEPKTWSNEIPVIDYFENGMNLTLF